MNSIFKKKNKNQKCNHDNFHCYHAVRSAAATAQVLRVSPGRSALREEPHQEPPQDQQCEKHNPGSLSVSASGSSTLGMNAMRFPFSSHCWGAFPSTGALSRKLCSIPAGSHQLLLSLQRCHRQGHPSPLSLGVTAGSSHSPERVLVVVLRGWEAHWTLHSGSHEVVTKPSI